MRKKLLQASFVTVCLLFCYGEANAGDFCSCGRDSVNGSAWYVNFPTTSPSTCVTGVITSPWTGCCSGTEFSDTPGCWNVPAQGEGELACVQNSQAVGGYMCVVYPGSGASVNS